MQVGGGCRGSTSMEGCHVRVQGQYRYGRMQAGGAYECVCVWKIGFLLKYVRPSSPMALPSPPLTIGQAHSTESQLHAEVEAIKGCLSSMQAEAQRWREEAEHRQVEVQVWQCSAGCGEVGGGGTDPDGRLLASV